MGAKPVGGPRVLIAHPGAEMYGSDRVLVDAAIGFAEAGWTVRVVIPDDGPLFDVLVRHNIEVQLLSTLVLRKSLMKPTGWPRLLAGYTNGRAQVIREIRSWKPDLVYVSTITQPLWAPTARALGVPVMLHVHEAEASARPFIRRRLYAPARAADRIVVNSSFAQKTMLDSYADLADRSEIVWNPVPGPVTVSPPRARIDGALRVGYVGRLSPRKGVDVAVEAVGILVADGIDAHLDLIGDVFEGYEWYELELHALAARFMIEDRVHFHGFRDSVWDAVADVDVLVVPSRFDEPFGNTAVEAVLARRPVIASDTSGLREATAGVPTAVLVAPDSAEDLATALAGVAANWSDVVARTDRAEQVVRDRHDVHAFRRTLTSRASEILTARR